MLCETERRNVETVAGVWRLLAQLPTKAPATVWHALTPCLLHSHNCLDQQLGIGFRELHEDQEQLQGRLHHQAVLDEGEGKLLGPGEQAFSGNSTRRADVGRPSGMPSRRFIHSWGWQEGLKPTASGRGQAFKHAGQGKGMALPGHLFMVAFL